MTNLDKFVQETMGGYSEQQLRVAFEKVENKENWKGAINAVIDEADFDLCNRATIFFTGSELTIFDTLPDGRVKVFAPGYYETVGA